MRFKLQKPDSIVLFQYLLAVIVFYIPFHLHYNYVINMFYHYGANGDASIFAHQMWKNDTFLIHSYPFERPFWSLHFMPILLLLNQISHITNLNIAEYYSTFVATTYAGFGLTLYHTFLSLTKTRNVAYLVLIAAISTMFSFNCIITHGMWMTHIEYLMPLGIFLFLAQYFKNNYVLAIIYFILTLMIREMPDFISSDS
jgi:hypothetical protein